MNQFFKEQLDFVPISWGTFADKERVDEASNELTDEIRRFKYYLMDKAPADRVIILEDALNELIFVYGQIRDAMKGLSNKEKDRGRPSMYHLYETVLYVLKTATDLKIQFSDEFKDSWYRRGIDKFFYELPESKESVKPKQEISNNAKTPYKQFDESTMPQHTEPKNCFVSDYKADELESIYNDLITGKYINKNTPIEAWNFICGLGDAPKEFKPVDWMKAQNQLAMLIDLLFGDMNRQNLWVITENAFTIKGKTPNIKTMKTCNSNLKNNWQDQSNDVEKLHQLLQQYL